MTVAYAALSDNTLTDAQQKILRDATGRIAPSWPLDQMIAVNPFWQMRDQPIESVSVQLAAMAGAHLFMPKRYYLDQFRQGVIGTEALKTAAREQGLEMSQKALVDFLNKDDDEAQWHNIADCLDNQRDETKMAWRDEIIHQISQFCAAHYQQQRPMLARGQHANQPDLYRHWLQVTRLDRGISIVMDEPSLHEFFQSLPEHPDDLIAQAIKELEVDDHTLLPYAHALLMNVNGWASWVAYLRWQGELYSQPNDDMHQLLAIRMAWELVIWRYMQAQVKPVFSQIKAQWLRQKKQLPILFARHEHAQKPIWVWAKAAELSYQQQLNRQLLQSKPRDITSPTMQAVFCIDVRSEVMRRALEAQNNDIQTFGFAGFFGLPIEYKPASCSLTRPQLPGLLKPTLQVTEVPTEKPNAKTLNERARWQSWSQAAPSSFTMIEATGWWYAFKMLKKSFLLKSDENPVNHLSHQQNWTLTKDGQPLTSQEKAALAQGILKAMGITTFAPTVLLVGHGSHTTNNLHAAGLDCGACGGQTGEVNVRVLAQLLNDPAVRAELATNEIVIPETTQFIAALHNTTTDHIRYFSETLNETEKEWLTAATKLAQRERIQRIDKTLMEASENKLDAAFEKRSKDWSQVRPEWGLANNAAFIVAPRSWTRQTDLQGRSFLHDYQWETDHNFATLEAIMTAPMVVTNWINMQYNASVTDNQQYGSGNKLLHNAVGGHIGLFEGNGGDLRIGLAMQSLHNGEKWMHQPQRLAVYLAAPREPIETITAKHENVRQLVDNEWLYLLRWSKDKQIERYYRGQWLPQS